MRTVRYTPDQLSPAIAERLNAASFFSSIGFARLWRSMGGREVYCVISASDRALAVLPGIEFGFFPFKRLQVMPDGCYAELVVLTNDPVDRRQLARSLWRGIIDAGYLRVHLTDYCGDFDAVGDFEVAKRSTLLVDVSDTGWEPPDKKIRSEIRKAAREGIVLERFDECRHLDGFMKLVHETAGRHGKTPRYGRAFYSALAGLATEDDRLRWVVARQGDNLAASHINVVIHETLLNWQVCSDKRYSFLKPNQYLLHAAANDHANRGGRFLSPGASPDNAPGLVSYKRKWGGMERFYNHYIYRSRLGRWL